MEAAGTPEETEVSAGAEAEVIAEGPATPGSISSMPPVAEAELTCAVVSIVVSVVSALTSAPGSAA